MLFVGVNKQTLVYEMDTRGIFKPNQLPVVRTDLVSFGYIWRRDDGRCAVDTFTVC